jgi:RNA polymerase sigma-70 factor, ECF subfamily
MSACVSSEFGDVLGLFRPARRAQWNFERVSESADQDQNREQDVRVLQRIAAGDRAAFVDFYDAHAGLLFSLAVRILNDPREAEDVLQDVCVQIWEKAGSYDPRLGRPLSWAVTLLRNKAIDRVRASVRRERLVEQAAGEADTALETPPTANEAMHGREQAALIRGAVAELPPEQRTAIELAFFSGLTQNEISERLREPLGTIKARIRRGMLKLRDLLEGAL